MIPILTTQDLVNKLTQQSPQRPYFAMYSSIYGGITLDPAWMLLPIDDHMVHRGDGVFEAIKFVGAKIYLLRPHLERLLRSALSLGLRPFAEITKLEEILQATVSASGQQSGLIRVFMSRGPGSFSVSPYDTIGTQFFVIVTALTPPSAEKFAQGVSIGRSKIPVKSSWMAQVKSCNYLPNVMMKKEAVDRGLDFVVGFDEQGYLAESATENIVILTAENKLVRPEFQNILSGTTMIRSFELAESLLQQGLIAAIGSQNISSADIENAKEIMMLGTTLDVLPVVAYEGKKTGDGKVGPVAQALLQLLKKDQTH